jgi:hypothetical protein
MERDRRLLAGQLVQDEQMRRGLKGSQMLDMLHMSRQTLYDLYAGKKASDVTLRKIEGALDWPSRFLSYVIAGDITRIEVLPLMGGFRPDIREHAVYELRRFHEEDERRETTP